MIKVWGWALLGQLVCRLLFLIVAPLLSSGFTFVTHVSARIFFVVFHIIVVIIIIK